MIAQARQIKQVTHEVPGADPAGLALALEVAAELPTPAPRAPEVAPATTRRRTENGHGHRRTARG
ncbi:hypothetical protein ACFYY3_31890 [Streptomyces sp. NPDC001812]|uniref:Uncharacterized protein n=1 Tax=Streptomyces cathayae TaxID=3031124 RepID=A0ABY8K410_9ACTN|nr:hypothetical protein [Streptomyces sp. HUAS 5]WGD42134.1 hypothetical protein PYS65_19415 [Streptomyces sp. HUAS 5]